jgi:hypothetical protein
MDMSVFNYEVAKANVRKNIKVNPQIFLPNLALGANLLFSIFRIVLMAIVEIIQYI